MIGKILNGLMNFIIGFVQVLLAPIDLAIETFLPSSVTDGLQYINNLFDYIISVVGYAIDASGLSDIAIGLVVAYWSFALVVPFTFSSIKLALKWYNSLKL